MSPAYIRVFESSLPVLGLLCTDADSFLSAFSLFSVHFPKTELLLSIGTSETSRNEQRHVYTFNSTFLNNTHMIHNGYLHRNRQIFANHHRINSWFDEIHHFCHPFPNR